MSDINISVTGTKRLKTAGKYCADDIVVTALGGDTDIKIQPSKTVTPTKSQQTVTPDSGYDVLSSVTVNKIPDNYVEPTGTENIYKNGTYDISAFKTVNVQVPTGVDVVCSVGDSFFSDSFLEGYDVDWSHMDCSVTPSGILSATLETDYYSFEALAEGQATIHFAFLENSGDETITLDVVVVVTASGGGTSENLDSVLAEQESLIAELSGILDQKAAGAAPQLNLGTCTVNIIPAASTNHYLCRETVATDGTISYAISKSYTSSKISVKARCDSVMYVQVSNATSAEVTGAELLKFISGQGVVIKTPSDNGATATITLKA